MGNFHRDSYGEIIDREKVIIKNDYTDLDGRKVNIQGYLVEEFSGSIINKYTFEKCFYGETRGPLSTIGELPMPFKLECNNFNPHEITGNFDFDE